MNLLLRTGLCVMLWLGTGMLAKAQLSHVDSLLNGYEQAQHDSTRLNYAQALIYATINYNPDTGLYYADIYQALAYDGQDTLAILEAQSARAGVHFFKGDHISSIKACYRGLALADSLGVMQLERISFYNLLSSSFRELKVHNYAERYLWAELEVYKAEEDTISMLKTLVKIGTHYIESDKYAEASQALEIGQQIVLQTVNSTHEDRGYWTHLLHVELFRVYTAQQRYAEAIDQLDLIRKCEYVKTLSYPRIEFKTLELLEAVKSEAPTSLDSVLNKLQEKGFESDSEQLYRLARAETDSLIEHFKGGYTVVNLIISKVRLETWHGNYQGALAESMRMLEGINQYNLLSKRLEAYQLIENSAYGLHLGFSNRDSALFYLSLAYEHSLLRQEMNDSIFNDQETNQLIVNQINLDDAKQQAEAQAELDQQQLIAEEEKKQQRLVSWLLGLGLASMLVIAVVLYRSIQNKKRANNIIQAQKKEVEEQRDMVEEKNKEILDSIQYAKRLQEAILPPQRLVKEWLPKSFILYKPKDIVAGDFYWMETMGDVIYFAAADCTGHGVPGAMVSVVCSNALNKALLEEGLREPASILDRTRELVVERFERSEEEVKDGMDISLCAINLKTNALEWAGANNPIWIIRQGAEAIEEIKANKQPIGKHMNETPFTNHDITLSAGDTLYIFSDGYPDQFGGVKGKKYKSSVLKKTLLGMQDKTMDEQRKLLDVEFEAWRGSLEQVDDVCVIGLRV